MVFLIEEIIVVYEATVSTTEHKENFKILLAVFTNTVLLLLDVVIGIRRKATET